MKVTSGIRKGALLAASKDLSVRPTTDKVKQSVFNMIQFEIADRIVLDLFAGSGAMGIEALSRGAKHCTFVDINPEFAIKNIEKLRFGECSQVVKSDYLAFLNRCTEHFNLVFLDPPYEKGMLDIALETLLKNKLLLPESLIVWECDAAEQIRIPDVIQIIKERTFGRVQVRIGALA
ncbi:MAG: 16S rRNA (guanine(966)-N(2))-methyltransferase RsmD [Clostridia bacterium]|nr:16S rRNA (guanine(966)-N(2))-methyltransferase RsmD [Clostridia bacterium]